MITTLTISGETKRWFHSFGHVLMTCLRRRRWISLGVRINPFPLCPIYDPTRQQRVGDEGCRYRAMPRTRTNLAPTAKKLRSHDYPVRWAYREILALLAPNWFGGHNRLLQRWWWTTWRRGATAEFFDSNGPLHGIKRDLYDGGVRVPMIVRWLEKLRQVNDQLALWDFLPTATELAGIQTPEGIDGISILPALLGSSSKPWISLLEFHERGFERFVWVNGRLCVMASISLLNYMIWKPISVSSAI